MSDVDNNMFNDLEEEPSPEEPKGGPSNRNFLVVVGVIGGILLLAIIVMVFLLVFYLPRVNANKLQQAAMINAQNTATALAATQVAQAQVLALTPSPTTPPTATQKPSPTPVVVFATNTFMPTQTKAATQETLAAGAAAAAGDLNSRTQTVSALLTQAAGGTTGGKTSTPGAGGSGSGSTGLTPTTLPTTGFVEEVGLPGMLGLSILLIAVIFFVRRLRLSGGQG